MSSFTEQALSRGQVMASGLRLHPHGTHQALPETPHGWRAGWEEQWGGAGLQIAEGYQDAYLQM